MAKPGQFAIRAIASAMPALLRTEWTCVAVSEQEVFRGEGGRSDRLLAKRLHPLAAALRGYFSGDVTITGNPSQGGGSFKIDHPLEPANKYVSHSVCEENLRWHSDAWTATAKP
jgi:hypothetical protein